MDANPTQPNGADNQPRREMPQLTVQQAVRLFIENLSELQKAGLPVVRSLRITQQMAYNLELASVLGQVSNDVEGGDSLAEALKKHPIFDPITVAMFRAGEVGGVLDIAINSLCELMIAKEKAAKTPVPFHTTADARLLAVQLGALIQVGTPMLSAIELAKQGTSPEMQAVLELVRNGVRDGEGFVWSIENAGGSHLFGPVFMACVAVGDEAGKLDVVLKNFSQRS